MTENFERGAGVLCPISSLPNKYGIGSLGKEAYEFARILKGAGVKYWQILPTVHTGYSDSPYQAVCSFSGNPYFIDLEALHEDGLIDKEELQSAQMPAGRINYAELYEKRFDILRLAYARFNIKDKEFVSFVESKEFEEYALFMSLKTRFGGSFDTFPDAYKFRDKIAMIEFRRAVLKSDFLFWQFVQFVYLKQWQKLKDFVNSLGIKLIGDVPLYVAYDSADVWAHHKLFKLDRNLKPTLVAGVPPDYFSEKGQLWGNPVYDWEAISSHGFEWWIKRIERAKNRYDIIRIDHFRGFDRFYAIPADSTDATSGEWMAGPGTRLFFEIQRKLGEVNIIAEDLGEIDAGVVKLMERTGFPGMKVLQFAFNGDPENPHLPSSFSENCVVYTGTHDNDTVFGYLNSLDEDGFRKLQRQLRAQLKKEGITLPFVTREQTVWAMNTCALASNASIAVLPVQDIEGLTSEARINIPSTADGNWQYRMEKFPSRRGIAILTKVIKQCKR